MRRNPNRKPPSLRTMMLAMLAICWVLPIVLVTVMAGFLLDLNYRRSAQQELETRADTALRETELRLQTLIEDSKAVSYDGIVRNAYRSFQYDGDNAALYRTVNDYLTQSSFRNEMINALFVSFWEDIPVHPYAAGNGALSYGAMRSYRSSVEPELLREMADADTAVRLLAYEGDVYLARNLLDSRFVPYATVVFLCDTAPLMETLAPIQSIGQAELTVGGICLTPEGISRISEIGSEIQSDFTVSGAAGDLPIRMDVRIGEMSIWSAIPELRIAIPAVILLILPLLAAVFLLYRRQVTVPVRTLSEASERLEAGERGYTISGQAHSREFQSLFTHFNTMSEEMKNQFERSYREQQALQQARMKTLQSQINPHFLNNTLEVINWEARIAGADRAGAMIEALSTMLDAALDRDNRSQIRLREELEYADAYLYIIQQRIGDRLKIVKEIDESLLDVQVPRLILQPLAENAVEHDLAPKHGGQLCIRIRTEENRICIDIEHNGVLSQEDLRKIGDLISGSSDAAPDGRVGLRNVAERLHLLYGDEGRISVEQAGPDTIRASVSFPLSGTLPGTVQ